MVYTYLQNEPRHEKTSVLQMQKLRQRSASGTNTADPAFVFPTKIAQSLFFLLPKPLTIFCIYTARFLFKQIGNPEDGFSHDEANIYKM